MKTKTKLPNSKNCFACGMENPIGLKLEMYAGEHDGVVCDFTVPRIYEGYPGIVHGGVVTTMLDEVISRVYMAADHNRFMYTAKLTTKYRKHVPVETPLHMIGEWIKDRGRTAEAKARIFGPDGELLAEGEALLIALPPDDLNAVDLQELGWRVYPDKQ
jgi:acyl-coenzyme A thioesterase PaaI-like protein